MRENLGKKDDYAYQNLFSMNQPKEQGGWYTT